MSRARALWPAWKKVARRLAAERRVALCSDFDGTLAPIVRRPGQARLPAATRKALWRLARSRRVTVAVVSGRSLQDLRRRVRLAGLHYIGSHGEEWAGPDGRRHAGVPAGVSARLEALGKQLEAELNHLPGIYVERKTVSVAVHYRAASARVAAKARRRVRRLARQASRALRLLEGKKVLELLPPGRMDKGLAVLRLAAKLRRGGSRPLVIYLGDDVTDESVFARLTRRDLGIHVGAGTATRARYRLRSPEDVVGFLRRLCKVVA